MAEVSVVIPAFNAARTIGETLASLTSQTFGDFEAIVVDDGSSDTTASIVSSNSDPRIRVISTANAGVATARNHAISQASGALVAFLDADDLWEPGKLERQVEALRLRPEAGVCVTGALRVGSDSRPLGAMPLTHPDDVTRALLFHSMIVGCISSGLVRKDLLDAISGFNPAFSQCADWDLWLRLSLITQFEIIDLPLVRYRSSTRNMSSDVALLERDTFSVLRTFFAADTAAAYRSVQAHVYAAHWMVCSGAYLHDRRYRDSLRCLGAGIRADSRSARRPLGLPKRWLRRLSQEGRRHS
jgi:glycosyltransferase involved in cell wall biosynthesis